MTKAPLLESLINYHKENNLILSMPGNKSGKAFLRDEIGREFIKNLGNLDITEVDPLDNLHNPEGVIKEAQELLAEIYKVKKAFFVVNGSSAGNLAAIFSAFNEGDEVLVERNCHKSIYNALILRKLKIIYIDAVIDYKNEIFLPPTEKEIEKAISSANNPKGVILTSPNYFGIRYNIDEYLIKLKEKGLKIIIDSAHGAHFGVNKKLPKSLAALGDYVVMSAHKTLPCLTQGSFLLVNDEEDNIEFYLRAFMTTSPSYLIMASLDYSRYYLDKYGDEDYSKLVDLAEKYKVKINNLDKVLVLDNKDLIDKYEIDKTRYLLITKDGYSGHRLLEYLRKNNIQGEMSFSKGVVLIFSPSNTEEDFERLYSVLDNLNINERKTNEKKLNYQRVVNAKVFEPYEVFNFNSEYCELNDSIGKVAKEEIIPYPPGIPIICRGEIITKEAIDIVRNYLNYNLTVLGIKDNKIKVVKEY
ncbi:aminotransferase class I/II-fold pyridoxal phosphate-dependent enzyme [Caproiciproducens sp. MSJ-32]|uniref:aminotransferase class I/II-fold pyridoxal phosphate-dependent enzyme n=1 Tax=Caproiciproducens sp. MSJ-32 TaxID=2841527 RepID=UPI001C1095AC|nr:aminotransferase class I/II-fold pyridoxal phosphate-dependent enzyme [Caproiciproducens sp. MSJ-32]MBU5454305.1 aminotransferase class I/II-fold pyridoxal phosphate-dependent enzyme [Caproiciproducens sp. MSJ-32]